MNDKMILVRRNVLLFSILFVLSFLTRMVSTTIAISVQDNDVERRNKIVTNRNDNSKSNHTTKFSNATKYSLNYKKNTTNNTNSKNNMNITAADADPRIIGGTPVAANTYPSMAFTAGTKLCGGTLIYEDIILTAAHCGTDAFAQGALVGGTKIDGSESTFVGVKSSNPHPQYHVPDNKSEAYDYMLVKLVKPVTSVPTQAFNCDPNIPADNDILTVIGYGNTQPGGTFSNVLLGIDIPVITTQACTDYYGPTTIYDPTMFCAGVSDGSKDSCQGDSGGPIFNSAGIQVGIVSFADGCAKPNVPGVYSQLSGAADFIYDGICNLSDNPPDCCTSNTCNSCKSGSTTSAPTAAPSASTGGGGGSSPTSVTGGTPTAAPSALAGVGGSNPTAAPTQAGGTTTTSAPVTKPLSPTRNPLTTTPTQPSSPGVTPTGAASPSNQPPVDNTPNITAYASVTPAMIAASEAADNLPTSTSTTCICGSKKSKKIKKSAKINSKKQGNNVGVLIDTDSLFITPGCTCNTNNAVASTASDDRGDDNNNELYFLIQMFNDNLQQQQTNSNNDDFGNNRENTTSSSLLNQNDANTNKDNFSLVNNFMNIFLDKIGKRQVRLGDPNGKNSAVGKQQQQQSPIPIMGRKRKNKRKYYWSEEEELANQTIKMHPTRKHKRKNYLMNDLKI